MAFRSLALIPTLLVAGLVLGPVAAVWARAGALTGLNTADLSALWFTLWQAAASAALSVGLAIPVARALARRSFPGRGLLISVMGAPFILPVIVAVLGLIMVFGARGWLNSVLGPLGVPKLDVYGIHGILLAHVFFNLPLAIRILLQGWLAVPAEQFRLAASLNASVWRLIEWPMLLRHGPGAFAIIFVICSGSFAVALTLGGGPKATTIELAIYQAFKFEFDLGKAATLALVQLAIGVSAGLAALMLTRSDSLGAGFDRIVQRWDGASWADGLWIALAAAFLLLPLAALVFAGVPGLAELPQDVWRAALRSASVACGATLVTLLLALALSHGRSEVVGLLGISVSSLVLGTGLFLLLQPYVRPAALALPVTLAVNALMALPFALRVIRPEFQETRATYHRLCETLGLSLAQRWWHVYLPRMRRSLGFAAGLTAALAMGDLGVITLFADGDTATLPMYIYRLMGSYRMDAAYSAALLLLALSLGAFWVLDRSGRRNA